MKNWFGKNCRYLTAVWEEDETIDPDFKEYEPVLKYCKHPLNICHTEGNCFEKICPLSNKKEPI